MIKRFRARPVHVEAIQLRADNLDEVCEFLGGEAKRNLDFSINYVKKTVLIHSLLRGTQKAKVNDWIVRHDTDEFQVLDFVRLDKFYAEISG